MGLKQELIEAVAMLRGYATAGEDPTVARTDVCLAPSDAVDFLMSNVVYAHPNIDSDLLHPFLLAWSLGQLCAS